MIELNSHIGNEIIQKTMISENLISELRIASAKGITHIIATPNINGDTRAFSWKDVLVKAHQLQDIVEDKKIPIWIHAGAELLLDDSIWKILDRTRCDYCLAGSHYVLVALPEKFQEKRVIRLIQELMRQDYLPIIAQPECHPYFINHPQKLLKWMHQGVLIECNLESLSGASGKRIQRTALNFTEHQMVTFLGNRKGYDKERYNGMMKELYELIASDEYLLKTWVQCQRNGENLLKDKFFGTLLPVYWKKSWFYRFSLLIHNG